MIFLNELKEEKVVYSEPDWEVYLKKYYDTFDRGHDREHAEAVVAFADKLAKKHDPKNRRIIRAAAYLHDIGISKGRENHAQSSMTLILQDPELKKFYTKNELKMVAYAAAEHRSSTGKPKTIMQKIISDADRISAPNPVKRAYLYGVDNLNLQGEEAYDRAGAHIVEKYSKGGKGRRVYFPESEKEFAKKYDKIIKAYKKNDIATIKKLVNESLTEEDYYDIL